MAWRGAPSALAAGGLLVACNGILGLTGDYHRVSESEGASGTVGDGAKGGSHSGTAGSGLTGANGGSSTGGRGAGGSGGSGAESGGDAGAEGGVPGGAEGGVGGGGTTGGSAIGGGRGGGGGAAGRATGGSNSTGGTGGTTGTGGTAGSGSGSGGTSGSGGSNSTGGNGGSGGSNSTGGTGGSSGGSGGTGGTGGSSGGTGGTGGTSTGGAGMGGSAGYSCTGTLSGGTVHATSNASGTAAGLSWTVWSNGSGGSITTYAIPAFSAAWNNSGDFLARLGLQWNGTQTYDQLGTITAQFASRKTGTGGGFSYIGVYGWSVSPCIEWYIIDDSYQTMPVNPGSTTNKGTAVIDGGTYNLYTRTQTGTGGTECGSVSTWTQFYSVRQTARQCGQISITSHFEAWTAAYMTLGNLLEARILVEVGGGNGSIDFTTANVTAQ